MQTNVVMTETEEPDSRNANSSSLSLEEEDNSMGSIKQRIQDRVSILENWRERAEKGTHRSDTIEALKLDLQRFYGYNEQLCEYFLQLFSPQEAIEFFEVNETARPMTIRANTLKMKRRCLAQFLIARGANVNPTGDWSKVGLTVLSSTVPIGATPEYLSGGYILQSASSLIPVQALDPLPGEWVVDMAAAPGGKATHIGQLMRNQGILIVNDAKRERCAGLVGNMQRMGILNSVVVNLDGRLLSSHLPSKRFDRVLLDAPCSGIGIISRDPSVKLKRDPKDFEEHSKLQKQLLTTAIDLVDAHSKTGGYVVYSTCSLSIEENEAVINHVLSTRRVNVIALGNKIDFGSPGLTKFREKRFHPSIAQAQRFYPHVHNLDGFFVCKLKKESNDVPVRERKDRRKRNASVLNWDKSKWDETHLESVLSFA